MSKGQSLFEVVLALAIIALIAVALVSLTTISIRNTSFSKTETQANRFAQEAVEWLRSERDADFEAFRDRASTSKWCLQGLNWNKARGCFTGETVAATNLRREANFSILIVSNKEVVETAVLLYWNDSQGYHEVRSTTNFTDWR